MEEEHKTEAVSCEKPEKRSYIHVPEDCKLLLLLFTIDQAMRLSKAARVLGIKYTTARHVVKKFKAASAREKEEQMARVRAFAASNQGYILQYFSEPVMTNPAFAVACGGRGFAGQSVSAFCTCE